MRLLIEEREYYYYVLTTSCEIYKVSDFPRLQVESKIVSFGNQCWLAKLVHSKGTSQRNLARNG